MKGRGPWIVVVAVMGMAVAGAADTELLHCGVECVCKEVEKPYEHEYRVECNASSLLEATVTEQLLEGMTDFSVVSTPSTSVTVDGDPSLTLIITLDFLLRWREFAVCSLNVVGAGSVIFPPVVPPFTPNKSLEHYYAGVSLTQAAVSEVPANIFNSKAVAVLRLNSSTVGRLPAGLLKGMTSLGRLHIINSTVGVMEGLLGGPAVNTESHLKETMPVLMANSTVGLLSGGAIHLKAQQNQKIMLQGLSLGRVDSGAVEVEGGKVVVEQCVAMLVEAGALLMKEDTHLALRNNWLVLQPDALTRLQCGQDEHQVEHNHFSVLDNDTAFPVSLTLQQGEEGGEEEKIAERERLAGILSTVIHPSCVSYNLAPQTVTPPTQSSWSFDSPGQLAVFGVIGLLLGLIAASLALLVFQHHSRSRRQRHVMPPAVVMSQLSDEPIYEEPNLTPPEVPPFPHCLSRANQNSASGSTPGACCKSEGRGNSKDGMPPVENNYITMKGY